MGLAISLTSIAVFALIIVFEKKLKQIKLVRTFFAPACVENTEKATPAKKK
jgi:hypothetical protein